MSEKLSVLSHVVPVHEKGDITSRRYIVEDAITFRDMPRATGMPAVDVGDATIGYLI
jgi:hypothetical protein